ncbi:uncharacterized protein ACA1_108790 [Acanthamoeba castellanii str. Neff]|uniref:Uncharacterized protein n=1 Tax=Acanthamoeba castellanii (strain ATCC 30010 / Neff) TaxID=1257118 RepID=L8GC60_ACACF|nr:uncharacterized protein ACA1_108790 [Acanthamoeba castellanii str. Neff]ELR10810.1 hypothetical protein ACA1_108790 [Acanthamoeba castellanii str. Neff]
MCVTNFDHLSTPSNLTFAKRARVDGGAASGAAAVGSARFDLGFSTARGQRVNVSALSLRRADALLNPSTSSSSSSSSSDN